MSAGISFLSFSLILFLICSTTATHFVSKFLKGYTHLFKVTSIAVGNRLNYVCRYDFFGLFF